MIVVSRLLALMAFTLVLPACQPAPELPKCELKEVNHLKDIDFAQEAISSRSKHWTGIQHAGEKSFTVNFDGPVAIIEKTGTQPWFLYRQRLRSGDFSERKLVFSAEVKLIPSSNSVDARASVGGLRLSAISSNGKPSKRVEQGVPKDSEYGDWQSLQLIALIPKNTQTLEVSFFHELDGAMHIRNPSLREVRQDSEACSESQQI